MSGPTLNTIASELGLSKSTVSRALNNSSLVNEETKRLVWETARRLNYRTNALAKGLAQGKSYLIGVIASHLSNSFYSTIVYGIQSALLRSDYQAIYFDSFTNPNNEARHLDTLLKLRVDGIIMTTTWPASNIFSEVISSNTPLVFVDNIVEDVVACSVTVDNYLGIRMAVEHLVKLNHERIAFLAGREYVYVFQKRLKGYLDAMNEFGLTPDVLSSNNSAKDGYETMTKVLRDKSRQLPTAIVCVSDTTAMGALRAIREHGLSVPEDISIVGFNNLDVSEYTEPPLTTVSQPGFEMGKMATEIILHCIDNDREMKMRQNVVLSPELIIRESTRALR